MVIQRPLAGMEGKTNDTSNITTLRELNEAEVRGKIPAFVIIAALVLLGIVGNSLVLHVYRSSRRLSNSQWFIMCLAASDLFSVAVAIPLVVATEVDNYEFENVWLCKLSRLFSTWASMSSAALLLVIATERFRKVCRPNGWQINYRTAKILSVLSVLIGLTFAWSTIVMYGKRSFVIKQYGLIGTKCSIDDSISKTIYPLINQLVLCVVFFVGAMYMCFLYCIIGYKTRLHTKKMLTQSSASIPLSKTASVDAKSNTDIRPTCTADDTGNNGSNGGNYERGTEIIHTLTNQSDTALKPRSLFSRVRTLCSTVCLKRDGSISTAKAQDRNEALATKITVLMSVISIAFVVSYTPHVILMILQTANADFVDSLSEDESKVYFIFIGSYFLNFITNPVIYGVCDPRFREALNEIFSWPCKQATPRDPNHGI